MRGAQADVHRSLPHSSLPGFETTRTWNTKSNFEVRIGGHLLAHRASARRINRTTKTIMVQSAQSVLSVACPAACGVPLLPAKPNSPLIQANKNFPPCPIVAETHRNSHNYYNSWQTRHLFARAVL